MKILMVYPEYPNTFWSFKHALKFINKKASFPPLGLLTVAGMLPKDWEIKLIDIAVKKVTDNDLLWADFVFISAMSVQRASAEIVIERCHQLGVKTVAGGPLFTSSHDQFPLVDHFVLNEAEITLPYFLEDLKNGTLKRIYQSSEWADMTHAALPRWDLISPKNYSSMNIQYSRGCPYDCEFCDITVLYGRKPRTKNNEQMLAELQNLYDTGYRGPLFIVDDNFIGNKTKLKKETLPAIADWMKTHNHPFYLNTEATINLADDDELLNLMVDAGFTAIFVGIETPNEESLLECNKKHNTKRSLLENIKKLQRYGLEVQGGFIVGFDNDPPHIFDTLADFIQESGIVTAMVGLLNAPRGTKLEKRLLAAGRITEDFNGNNTDAVTNVVPVMNKELLLKGYKKVLDRIYSPKPFYNRVISFLKDYTPNNKTPFQFHPEYIIAFIKSIVKLGIIGKERIYFWKLFFWSLLYKPKTFSLGLGFAIYGFHFRKIYEALKL